MSTDSVDADVGALMSMWTDVLGVWGLAKEETTGASKKMQAGVMMRVRTRSTGKPQNAAAVRAAQPTDPLGELVEKQLYT